MSLPNGRGGENRTPTTRPPALRTTTILHPEYFFKHIIKSSAFTEDLEYRIWGNIPKLFNCFRGRAHALSACFDSFASDKSPLEIRIFSFSCCGIIFAS